MVKKSRSAVPVLVEPERTPPTDRVLCRADDWDLKKGDRLRDTRDGSIVILEHSSAWNGQNCCNVRGFKNQLIESSFGRFMFVQRPGL